MNILSYRVQAVYIAEDRTEAENKFQEVQQALAGKDCTVLVVACMDDDSELVMISSYMLSSLHKEQPQESPSAKLPRKLKKKLCGTRKNPR